MSNATKLVAALSVAGAVLASSPPSFAQEGVPRAYVSGVYDYPDCYYNPSQTCGPSGAYAAIAPLAAVDAYAAVNGIVQQPYYPVTTLWRMRGLRGNDWVAVHGANF